MKHPKVLIIATYVGPKRLEIPTQSSRVSALHLVPNERFPVLLGEFITGATPDGKVAVARPRLCYGLIHDVVERRAKVMDAISKHKGYRRGNSLRDTDLYFD